MTHIKKLTDEEFLLKLTNKELEIAGGPQFETFEELCTWSKENGEVVMDECGNIINLPWYQHYTFKSQEEADAWHEYYNKLFYEWQPKRASKRRRDETFAWINLQYGLKEDFKR